MHHQRNSFPSPHIPHSQRRKRSQQRWKCSCPVFTVSGRRLLGSFLLRRHISLERYPKECLTLCSLSPLGVQLKHYLSHIEAVVWVWAVSGGSIVIENLVIRMVPWEVVEPVGDGTSWEISGREFSWDRLKCDHFCQQWLPSPAMGLLQHSADIGTIPLTLHTEQIQSFLFIE